MSGPRPGIADADRRRAGPFVALLERIPHDSEVLDGLAFVYAELPHEGRRRLIQAIREDAPDAALALGALLVVERDSGLIAELAALIRAQDTQETAACLQTHAAGGEACLIRPLLGSASELLRITWNHNQITHIKVESGVDTKLEAAVPVELAIGTVAPILWSHIRQGGTLPVGAERFAGFFSLR